MTRTLRPAQAYDDNGLILRPSKHSAAPTGVPVPSTRLARLSGNMAGPPLPRKRGGTGPHIVRHVASKIAHDELYSGTSPQ